MNVALQFSEPVALEKSDTRSPIPEWHSDNCQPVFLRLGLSMIAAIMHSRQWRYVELDGTQCNVSVNSMSKIYSHVLRGRAAVTV